jgi:hypothetical protein
MKKNDIGSSLKDVISYLSNQPNEEDTFDGITSLWVRPDKGQHVIADLQYILNLLIEKGVVEQERRKG